MKNEKNKSKRNIGTRLMSLGLALASVIAFAGCSNSKQDEEIQYTFEEVLNSFSDDTNLDEIMQVKSEILITTEEGKKEVDFFEATKELEKRVDLNEKLKEAEIASIDNASKELMAMYALTLENAPLLLESLNETHTPAEEARIKAALGYINSQNEKWLVDNGLNVSIGLLNRVVQGAACKVCGLEDKYYAKFEIVTDNQQGESIVRVEGIDPVSNQDFKFNVSTKENDVLALTTDCLLHMNSLKNGEASVEAITSNCDRAITLFEYAAASDMVLDDNVIKSNSEKVALENIEQKIMTKTTSAPTTTSAK